LRPERFHTALYQTTIPKTQKPQVFLGFLHPVFKAWFALTDPLIRYSIDDSGLSESSDETDKDVDVETFHTIIYQEVLPMRKLLATLLTFALLLSLTTVLAETPNYTIVVNLKTLSSEYWQTVKSGIDEAAAEFGLTIDVQGPAAETEIAE